jgi:hypothetical protein
MEISALHALCAEKNIKIERRGLAYSLTAPGISILCADLETLEMRDLRPAARDS